jgi:hypothetical protein
VWPEVESLQDYKNTFPKWKPGSLASHVKNLDENGLDLLSVSELFFMVRAWCPWVSVVTGKGDWMYSVLDLSARRHSS